MLVALGGQHRKSVSSICGSFVLNQRKLFDIYFGAPRVGNDTQQSAFSTWLRGPTPHAPQPLGVTAALNFLIDHWP